MIAPQNRLKEFYSSLPGEECCNCREPFGKNGAFYVNRQRVCYHCYRDEEEWNEPDRIDELEKQLSFMGWTMIGMAGVVFACLIVSLFWGD